jgi:hypothetical protein
MPNQTRYFFLLFLTCIIFQFSVVLSLAQNKEDSSPALAGKTMFGATYRYQNLPNAWEVNYVGLAFVYNLSETISIAGPLYWGKAADGYSYFHFPIGGLMVALLGGSILNNIFEEQSLFNLGMIKYLFTENIHFVVSNSNKMIISPYISFMGFDVSQAYGPDRDQTALLGNGFGINLKTPLIGKLATGASLELKHFILMKPDQAMKNKFGYNLSLYLGFLF